MLIKPMMRFGVANVYLLSLALLVLLDALAVSRSGQPDFVISSAAIIALVLRGLDLREKPKPLLVVAFLVTLWVIANNSNLLDSPWGFWTVVGFVLVAVYALWERLFP
jgi:hypothetical protein